MTVFTFGIRISDEMSIEVQTDIDSGTALFKVFITDLDTNETSVIENEIADIYDGGGE